MLKEFRVRNFMNFRDELIFSLENKKSYEFNNDLISNGIIEKAAVIGYNASGYCKSYYRCGKNNCQ